jgi:pimeloyl-ACP methyl ester carboxylesterase
MIQAVEFADLDWGGRSLQVEFQWLGNEKGTAPLLVFLHEGLGSLAMWKDFPQRLCVALDCRGLGYSRPGYGRSSARRADEFWGVFHASTGTGSSTGTVAGAECRYTGKSTLVART